MMWVNIDKNGKIISSNHQVDNWKHDYKCHQPCLNQIFENEINLGKNEIWKDVSRYKKNNLK